MAESRSLLKQQRLTAVGRRLEACSQVYAISFGDKH